MTKDETDELKGSAAKILLSSDENPELLVGYAKLAKRPSLSRRLKDRGGLLAVYVVLVSLAAFWILGNLGWDPY